MTTNTQAQVPNYLEMSDEDILNMTAPAPVSADAATAPGAGDEMTGEKPTDELAATTAGEGGDDGTADTGANQEEGEATQANANEGEEGGQATGEEPAGADGGTPASQAGDESGAGTGDKKGAPSQEAAETKAVDYEAEYKRLLAPFKANGRDIQVDSVDDAISLMQMGANYNKRMAALKPNLKILKMLENNGLLDEGKLSFLIDLNKKDAGAINKLVKDAGIDPMEIDADKASAYKQSAYAVDDREIELDTVLDEIQGSQTYTRTLDVVSNKWDAASKQVIAQEPQLLKVIDSHMASGVYDLISAGIERERMFGRLKGVSDIEAYRIVGDAIQARGGFNHLAQKQSQAPAAPAPVQAPASPAPAPVVIPPKPKVDDKALNDKRRAAGSTKPAAPSTTPKDFNPLAMSDEEFAQLAQQRFR